METKIGNITIEIMKEQNIKYLSVGEFGALHDIFDRAIERKVAKPLSNPHPLNVFQRVLNALDRDERFKKNWITYPGIHKNQCRSFELREDFQ